MLRVSLVPASKTIELIAACQIGVQAASRKGKQIQVKGGFVPLSGAEQ
jgi:hypothetical protein